MMNLNSLQMRMVLLKQMDNEAGHKRKEFTDKSRSFIKKFWHDWLGDFNEPIKNMPKKIGSAIVFLFIGLVVFILSGTIIFLALWGIAFFCHMIIGWIL